MADILLSSFLVYQYGLLFVVSILAAFGIPIPATIILIAGGALYAQGYMDGVSLFFAGFIGCVLGDIIGYGLSYFYGKDIFLRIGIGKWINIDRLLARYGPRFLRNSVVWIFFSRWLLTGIGPSLNIVAGLTKMRYSRFIPTIIIGEFIYISLYIALGYSFGIEWEYILQITEALSSTIVTGFFLIFIAYYFWKRHLRREL